MATRHYADHGADEESYFVSMTDVVIGLLFVFIIMLMFFAMRFQEATQRRDETTQKQNILIDELRETETARQQVLQSIGNFLDSRGINVTIIKDEGVLRLPEDVLFAKSAWELSAKGNDATRTLAALADALDQVLPCYTLGIRSRQESCPKAKAKIEAIFIEGHADSDAYNPRTSTAAPPANPPSEERILGFLTRRTPPAGPAPTPPVRRLGPPRDNLDLSTLRATSTFRELMRVKQELGLYLNPNDKPVLSVSGYGEYRQVKREPNETDEAYKQRNRRIDLRILMAAPRSEDAKQMQQDLQRLESRP
jgi:flagellar motor protein MotB